MPPLAGMIKFSTSVRTFADICVSDGDREWSVPTANKFGFIHEYVVLGMRADRRHLISITVKDADGVELENPEPLEFETA